MPGVSVLVQGDLLPGITNVLANLKTFRNLL
jgi:hypothetical protein